MAVIKRKNLSEPDEVRRFPNGEGEMTRIGPLAIGRATLQPGWRWSTDVKPLAGTQWCEIHHLQLMVAGRMGVQMADGEEAVMTTNDVFEVPPGHDAWVVGDEPVVLLDFLGNIADFALPMSRERVLATLLMTDIVDSTKTAERLGDAVWKQVLANHNRIIRNQLQRYRGDEIDTTGDGFLATFSSPVASLRCAVAVSEECAAIGLPVRIGVHTGEIERSAEDVGGLAVHATARVMALGGASEIIVSSATRGLVEGSGLRFEERGRHQLKGIETPMEVYRLVG